MLPIPGEYTDGTRWDGGRRGRAGGFSFQDSVATWAAVGILAEQAVTPRWGLEPTTFFTEVRCETGLPVYDLMVATSADGAVYLQVKRALRLSERPDSDLASAVDQFVRQYLTQRSGPSGRHPWDTALDSEKDRLVLITDGRAPEWARVHLPAVLDRLRRDRRSSLSVDAAKNADGSRSLQQRSSQRTPAEPGSEPAAHNRAGRIARAILPNTGG